MLLRLGLLLGFCRLLVFIKIADLLVHVVKGFADTLGDLQRSRQRQAARDVRGNALVVDKILGIALVARRDPFDDQTGPLVTRTTGALFVSFSAHGHVAAVAHIFRCHRAGRTMGDRIEVADISRRAGPVLATLARIEKRAARFGFLETVAILRLGRGADFLIIGTAARRRIGRNRRSRTQGKTGNKDSLNGRRNKITSNHFDHGIKPPTHIVV